MDQRRGALASGFARERLSEGEDYDRGSTAVLDQHNVAKSLLYDTVGL